MKRIYKQFIVFYVIISLVTLILIFNSNFIMGFVSQNSLSIDHKIIIFSIYVAAFVFLNPILLYFTHYDIDNKKGEYKVKIYFVSIIIIYLILSSILIITTIQMVLLKSYSNLVFYLTTCISLISSFIYLSILSFNFFRWFLKGKNYFIFLYGILFSLYCTSIILALIYLINGLATHPSSIQPVSPRVLVANTYSINIIFQQNIASTYDILFTISLVLAWILTVLMLKQYSHRTGKYKFWFLVSLPLIFYLIHYEAILGYVHLYELINISTITGITSTVGDAILNSFINSQIQVIGLFFGLSFLPILLKINDHLLRRKVMITLTGITILFGSRDLHSLFVSSFPPAGVVAISFMVIGSFMLLIGLLSFLKSASRDKQFYSDIITRIENDSVLLKDIILSEKLIESNKKIKPLLDHIDNLKEKYEYKEMTQAEVQKIIQDIASEYRRQASQKLNSKKKIDK